MNSSTTVTGARWDCLPSGGRNSAGIPVENLCVIHPWTRDCSWSDWAMSSCWRSPWAADRSNLEDLAFQVHRKFDFVADMIKLTDYYLRGSQFDGGQFPDQGAGRRSPGSKRHTERLALGLASTERALGTWLPRRAWCSIETSVKGQFGLPGRMHHLPLCVT